MAHRTDRITAYLYGGLLLGTTLFTAASCTKGGAGSEVAGFDGSMPEIVVSSISPTSVHGVQGIDVVTVPEAEGVQVTVVAANGFSAGEELFLNVSFDPRTAHSENVQSVLSAQGNEVVSLAIEGQPGSIDFGAVTTARGGTAALPGDTLLSFRLLPGEADLARFVSSAGRNPALSRAKNLEFHRNEAGNWVLEWDYTNPGDYNQDGEVGITDITPIGVHFGEKVANSWNDKRRHIDADSNGEINLGDITPMGQNYGARIFAYNIEMSEDGDNGFIVVGQLLVDEEEELEPGETKRFAYEFGAQYVPGGWYRVVPLDKELQFGSPSEAISENGRRMNPVPFAKGQKALVTVIGQNMPEGIAHANAVRVVFPASYDYVPGSANAGKPGGNPWDPDGIWKGFADSLLFPPDAFHKVEELGNGRRAMDFNVTSLNRRSPAAPDMFGEIVNFRLESMAGDPLTLEFQVYDEKGIHRTYFSDGAENAVDFGNTIGLRVN
ncbi:MAG: hypothetical protein R3F46_07980 [bacterium]